MTARNLEKVAAQRRMKARGTEAVHESGYAHMREADNASAKSAEKVAQKIAAWKREPPFDEVVEAERHKPGKERRSRAEWDDWLRGILDSCED